MECLRTKQQKYKREPESFTTIIFCVVPVEFYPARALRALGLLLADGAPTVGGGKTF